MPAIARLDLTRFRNYAAFAIDVYGKGKRGATPEECQALMNPLVGNRAELQKRLNAGIVFSKTLPGVLQGKRAAVGFCFGGLCVLDIARPGMDVQGVAPFHGLFGAPDNIAQPANTAKVHIFHGYDDPMATPDDMVGVMNELTKAGADWQLTAYGNTKHSFTTEAANRPDMGMDYSADADRRSWGALMQFLGEILR